MMINHGPGPLTPEQRRRVWSLLGAVATGDHEAELILLQDMTRDQMAETLDSLVRYVLHFLEVLAPDDPERLAQMLRQHAVRAALDDTRVKE
jgi:hypothetical protein